VTVAVVATAEKMKLRVKDQQGGKSPASPAEDKKNQCMLKKGKGHNASTRFVFTCEGLTKSLPDDTTLFSDLTFSLYERCRRLLLFLLLSSL